MSCLYETVKDLKDRLHGTVCRYKGIPYYCEVTAKGKIVLKDVRTPVITNFPCVPQEISPKDEDFDISSIELGYVNFEIDPMLHRYWKPNAMERSKSVSFLARWPSRRYKQGISGDMLSCKTIDGHNEGEGTFVLHSEGFIKSCLNEYPSLPEAIERLSSGEADQIAVSKEFALKRTDSSLILAFCETKNIGWILPRTMKIEVPEGELNWVYRRMMDRLVSEF